LLYTGILFYSLEIEKIFSRNTQKQSLISTPLVTNKNENPNNYQI